MTGTGNKRVIIASALAFAAGGAVGCDDEDFDDDVVATDYTYEDAYLYDAYYPADVAYAGYYWADAWNYSSFYYYLGSTAVAAATTGSTTPGRLGIVGAIQGLARGEQICPGQVTVMEKFADPACDGSSADPVRNGVNIAFSDCQVSGGSINGIVEVQANRSAS